MATNKVLYLKNRHRKWD